MGHRAFLRAGSIIKFPQFPLFRWPLTRGTKTVKDFASAKTPRARSACVHSPRGARLCVFTPPHGTVYTPHQESEQ
eukprot:3411810-Prymnesium_polylepis.1